MTTDYSVLMPLWHEENLLFLEQSLASMVTQDIPPAEFVFVIDYPLSPEMSRVIDATLSNDASVKYVEAYQLKGKGLGALLNEGIKACSCSFIARMDSDDISFPDRCSKELYYLNLEPGYDVVGSFLTEFTNSPENTQAVRKVPQQGSDLKNFAKSRNPLNHPTVMLRKAAVISAGNYNPDFSYCEDYELWYRMLKGGSQFYNIQESLLYYRTGEGFLERRSRKENIHSYTKLKKQMLRDGFINRWEYFFSVSAQHFFSHSPRFTKKLIYSFLRTKQHD